ncbi:hypothetical protein [Seonamhaeicola aphaedonensis]|uniref:Uncharacterized protein n=1 Tax=Seonamhaeicola aphaedonensis TaxID=1461338 RepID=A0A3D9HH62_9FLAO|nr:hypothetical protein [Seonamhaeicola aphaedonensis]RED48810.1 hypothetical protein DFQ02_103140 [Seonamhaeicola aphaedonensis]
MKIRFLIILVTFTTIRMASQNSEQGSFYPLIKGQSKTLTWYKDKYREVIKDTVTLGGEIYNHIAQIFPPKNTIDIYLRNSNDTIYFYNTVKKTHMPFFGIRPVVGETIGNGTIVEVEAKLKTPKGKLTDLLVVEMNYSNGAQDTRYYKKGLGLVAVKNKNKLICYYIADETK